MNVHGTEAVSNYVDKTVVTPPLAPSNLRLDLSQPTSLKVKWDAPSYVPPQGKLVYNVSIAGVSPAVRYSRFKILIFINQSLLSGIR